MHREKEPANDIKDTREAFQDLDKRRRHPPLDNPAMLDLLHTQREHVKREKDLLVATFGK